MYIYYIIIPTIFIFVDTFAFTNHYSFDLFIYVVPYITLAGVGLVNFNKIPRLKTCTTLTNHKKQKKPRFSAKFKFNLGQSFDWHYTTKIKLLFQKVVIINFFKHNLIFLVF